MTKDPVCLSVFACCLLWQCRPDIRVIREQKWRISGPFRCPSPPTSLSATQERLSTHVARTLYHRPPQSCSGPPPASLQSQALTPPVVDSIAHRVLPRINSSALLLLLGDSCGDFHTSPSNPREHLRQLSLIHAMPTEGKVAQIARSSTLTTDAQH
jgi:hypothetical protein